MATPSEKLASSLEVLRAIQGRGRVAIRSRDLSRTHRERLCREGFLQEVIKGWYIPTRPDERKGESAAWYASFWQFCAGYLRHRFAGEWCLAPEISLALHTGNRTVPGQLLVRSPRARNRATALPHGTSLLDVRATMPPASDVEEVDGLRLFSLPAALIACSPACFRQNPTDVRAALSMVRDASEVLDRLLEGGHSTIAGRLAGAFRNIGREKIAAEIVATMRVAGYDVRLTDPFEAPAPVLLSPLERSPWVNRIRLLWQEMRGPVLDRFPAPPGLTGEPEVYLRRVGEIYASDAYHSLSIEGYRVDPELVERVRAGNWNPDARAADREQRNALAARGYWQAFQSVKESIRQVLQGKNPGEVADADHPTWYRELFAPSVVAGLLRPADLAGYRGGPVYIRRSMHMPPGPKAVRDAMPVLFDLLRAESGPAVRVVLGHFFLVYLHPYIDGNGRMGRFLMNLMLAAGGWPWTVIPVAQRDGYMAALEEASVRQNIGPFTELVAHLIQEEGG